MCVAPGCPAGQRQNTPPASVWVGMIQVLSFASTNCNKGRETERERESERDSLEEVGAVTKQKCGPCVIPRAKEPPCLRRCSCGGLCFHARHSMEAHCLQHMISNRTQHKNTKAMFRWPASRCTELLEDSLRSSLRRAAVWCRRSLRSELRRLLSSRTRRWPRRQSQGSEPRLRGGVGVRSNAVDGCEIQKAHPNKPWFLTIP